MNIFGLEIKRAKKAAPEEPQPPADTRRDKVRIVEPGKSIKVASIKKIRSPVLAYTQEGVLGSAASILGRGRAGSWEAPEYDLAQIGRVADVEGIIARIFNKKEGLFFKEGWDFVGRDPKVIKYIKKRVSQMEAASSQSFQLLLKETARSLIRLSNAFWVKVRKKEASGGKIRSLPSGKKLKPVAAYFLLPAETARVIRDMHGKHLKYRQIMPDGAYTRDFSADDVVHFYLDKKPGFFAGTPQIIPVLDDINALRRIEENVEILVWQCLFPLYHYKIGDKDNPASYTPDGDSEIDAAKAKMEEMPSEGMLFTDSRHEVKAIGAEGRALRVEGYLEYFKHRVFMGMEVSAVDMGESATTPRATADVQSKALTNAVKSVQSELEDFIYEFIIKELLLEANFSGLTPDQLFSEEYTVRLRFKEIDLDHRVKLENHAAQLFDQNGITETEYRKELSKEPITQSERKEMHWELYGMPENLIRAVDEPYLAGVIGRSPTMDITPQEAQSASAELKRRENEAAKKRIQPKKASRGSRAGKSQDQPQNQHGKKLSPLGLTKNELDPYMFKDHMLNDYFDMFYGDVVNAIKKGEKSTNWLARLGDAAKEKAREKFLVRLKNTFRQGLYIVGGELEAPALSVALDEIDGRVDRYLRKLFKDIVDAIDRNMEMGRSKKEDAALVAAALDSLRFRTNFIYESEKNKAYNYGMALGHRSLGYDYVIPLIYDEECHICGEYTDVIPLMGVSLMDVPSFHPMCNCTIAAFDAKKMDKYERCVLHLKRSLRRSHPNWGDKKIKSVAYGTCRKQGLKPSG